MSSEPAQVTVAGINAASKIIVTAEISLTKFFQAIYSAAKSGGIMQVTATLLTADIAEKLKLMYPNTAQALREAALTAVGLTFDTQRLTNLRLWEQDVPLLGFFLPSTNINYETILKTSVTVDAVGGESIIEAALQQAGETQRTQTTADTARLASLLKLLEKAPIE